MTKRVKIRLKGIQDTDLFLLKANPDFNFEKAIKKTLIAYVQGEVIRIPIPAGRANVAVDFSPRQIYIPFDTEDEGDVIDWLENLKKGYRNVAVKAVFRNYLAEPNLYGMYEKDVVIAVKHEVNDKKDGRERIKAASKDIRLEPANNQEQKLGIKRVDPVTDTTDQDEETINLFAEEDSFVDLY